MNDKAEGSGTKNDNSSRRPPQPRDDSALEEEAQGKQLEDSMNANAVAALICPAMVAQEEEEEYMSQVSRWLEF